jgi:hypothetical protein
MYKKKEERKQHEKQKVFIKSNPVDQDFALVQQSNPLGRAKHRSNDRTFQPDMPAAVGSTDLPPATKTSIERPWIQC